MRVVVMQPHFLPFVGYFDLMRQADTFVYLDTVQLRRRSWHCRTWISEQNQASWLSASVSTNKGSRIPLNNAVWADDTKWRAKAARRLETRYRNTRQRQLLASVVDLIRSGPHGVADWNVASCSQIAEVLDIRCMALRTSQLPSFEGDKQLRLIRICEYVGADTYLCGPGSRNYISETVFARHGIDVEWLDYEYAYQLHTARGEMVYPSVLEPLLLQGIAETQKELKTSKGQSLT